MVARGDAVLIGLIGFFPLFIGACSLLTSGFRSGLAALVLLFVGGALFLMAITLYFVAEPSPWTPRTRRGGRPMVTLACPIYGTPLSWVDEVSQWYCPQCQAYHGAKPA